MLRHYGRARQRGDGSQTPKEFAKEFVNVRDEARRAKDIQHAAGAPSRRRLHYACWNAFASSPHPQIFDETRVLSVLLLSQAQLFDHQSLDQRGHLVPCPGDGVRCDCEGHKCSNL